MRETTRAAVRLIKRVRRPKEKESSIGRGDCLSHQHKKQNGKERSKINIKGTKEKAASCSSKIGREVIDQGTADVSRSRRLKRVGKGNQSE